MQVFCQADTYTAAVLSAGDIRDGRGSPLKQVTKYTLLSEYCIVLQHIIIHVSPKNLDVQFRYGFMNTVYHDEHHHLLDISMKVTHLS